jgi:Meiotically up-regulated gene 113
MTISICKSCQSPLDQNIIDMGFRYCSSCHDQYRSSRAESQASRKKKKAEKSVVYFIQGGNAIKIGYTTDLKSRLSSMQTDCPLPLVVLKTMPGGRPTETLLHEKFASARKSGEWFEPTIELIQYIKKL